ncbi:MAG TPA: peptidylprolyl isomerase [Microscillaceae bacterium]|jgi:peptidyl-prolyl cis-trans isomerase B (cyclophilin B)|nr:peptidylprolyl isomerase [Microscillaceae bacterium]
MARLLIALIFLCVSTMANPLVAQTNKKDYLITISTAYGDMKLVLFDQTPLHKANFLKLVQEGFYDEVLFHRVIQSFMIQGGDPESRNAPLGTALGNGTTGYTVPAEFHPDLFHKKGVLAAARKGDDVNPNRESSGCQFYIVQGKVFDEATLTQVEETRLKRKLPEAHREVYKTLGGAPHLDQAYTVFGELLSGFEVIDAIAAMPVDERNRPLANIAMKITVEKTTKSKITKAYNYNFLP